MKALKAFIKPLVAPQIRVKIKLKLIFSLCPGTGRERLWIISNSARKDLLLYRINLHNFRQQNLVSAVLIIQFPLNSIFV